MSLKNVKYLITFTLAIFILFGYAKKEKISSNETTNPTTSTNKTLEYAQATKEIQEFLSTTPLGSEVYLEEKENGEWYLKLEKTFSVQKDQENTKTIEPIYAESILIWQYLKLVFEFINPK